MTDSSVVDYNSDIQRWVQILKIFSEEGKVERKTIKYIRGNYVGQMRLAGNLVRAANRLDSDVAKIFCFQQASHALTRAKAIDAALKQFNL